jgi:anti-sigma B factor antagonist
MDIDVTGSAGITVVAPRGDLDMAAADQMKRTLTKLLDDGSRKLLVDLGQVGYVDSSGMGALVASLKHARTVGGDLRLCALQDDVRAIFEMTRLNRAVTIHGSRSEALGAWT